MHRPNASLGRVHRLGRLHSQADSWAEARILHGAHLIQCGCRRVDLHDARFYWLVEIPRI
jgi:hypothetical protein